jgi:hypothetical protein
LKLVHAYLDVLQNELPLLLEEVPLAKRTRMVFQHDGAPARYSRLVTHHLNLTLSKRWIGRGDHVQWPPYSFRFSSVGMDVKRNLQRKSKHKDELVARITNSAALLKQERQDDLMRATRTVVKK